MAELLNTLLDISLLESGAVTPEPRDISIHNLLAQIEAANLPHADKKGLRLRVSPADFMVHTDLALLQRIVENFVSNAIRYTDDGEVCVECRQTANGLQIEVRDSGCGIPADRLDSVFDEYVQLDNEAHDRKKGLGLGLAIVKYIARLLDHPLSVTSVAGKGSTFSVTVPLAANPVAVAVKPVAASHQAVNSTAKILLIDDDPMVIDAAMLLLQEEQFEVYAARDGKAALDHIAQGLRPDMIVSDYRLPGQNGIEVVRNIKQMLNSEPVIIFMTGDSSIRKIHDAKIENAHVLQKPVNAEKLMTLIRRSLV